MEKYFEKIKANGEIRIPKHYMKALDIYPGEEVEIKIKDETITIEPVKKSKSRVKDLTGIIAIDDPDTDKIVESEEWY